MNFKNISGTALMLKYRPISSHNVLLDQTVANVLDFIVAVITITIKYPHIDVIVCWCTLCARVHPCVRACMCKTSCHFF